MKTWTYIIKKYRFVFLFGSFFWVSGQFLMLCHYWNYPMKTKYLLWCLQFALLHFHWMLSFVFFKSLHFWVHKGALSLANWSPFSSSQAVYSLLNGPHYCVMLQMQDILLELSLVHSNVFVLWPKRQQSFVYVMFGLIIVARGKMRRRSRNKKGI